MTPQETRSELREDWFSIANSYLIEDALNDEQASSIDAPMPAPHPNDRL